MNNNINTHMNIFACLCIAGSVLQFIILFFVLLLQSVFIQNSNSIIEIIITFIISFLLITITLGLITGIGLFMKKSWSRITGLIISCISLFSIPIGTAFGIYGLWILFNDDAIKLLAPQDDTIYNDPI